MKVAGALVLAVTALVVLLTWPSAHAAAPPELPKRHVLELRPLRLDPALSADEQRWILVSIGHMRPEALGLIDEVPGTVSITGFWGDGLWQLGDADTTGPGSYQLRVNTARLDTEAEAHDRDPVVAHEFGHVVEMALLPLWLRDAMVAELPASGACPHARFGDCALPSEKFADTFARWALHGRFPADVGYAVQPPASVEAWGAPLSKRSMRPARYGY